MRGWLITFISYYLCFQIKLIFRVVLNCIFYIWLNYIIKATIFIVILLVSLDIHNKLYFSYIHFFILYRRLVSQVCWVDQKWPKFAGLTNTQSPTSGWARWSASRLYTPTRPHAWLLRTAVPVPLHRFVSFPVLRGGSTCPAHGVGGDPPVRRPLAPAPAAPGAAVPDGAKIPEQLRAQRGNRSSLPASSSSPWCLTV